MAREGNITGAAASLHLTQPTLSRQIRDLEEELGQKLLIRKSHKVMLTPEGMLLRKRAEEILAMVDRTEAEFASMESTVSGDVYIGGGETRAIRQIAEIIKEIRIPEVKANYLMYRKIGTRRANAISKLSLSALAFVEDGVIKDFRASSGAAGPKVRRNREVESLLIGKKRDELDSVLAQFLTKYDSIISPHAMPEYRRNTTRRMLIYFIEKIKQSDECGVV